MKDIYKNPVLYYILIPVIVALWPAVMWGLYLPRAQTGFNTDKEQFEKAEKLINEMLSLDPGRLNFAQEEGSAGEFDYATAVQKTAEFCSIPAAGYRLSSGIIITSQDQKSQSANVSLKDVDITKAARFVSTIQLRWSGLQCTKVTLRKKKALPDSWDVDLAFKYYY